MENLETPQEQTSEFDTTQDVAELDGIQKELSDIEASLESNFAKYISDMIDNDSNFEELFFSDREAFFKKVIDLQNKFVSELVEPRMARANELQNTIQGKNELANIEAIKQDFMARHPDVDIQELIRFFAEDLSPRVQSQIKEQPMENFFDIVFEIYSQQMQPQGQGQEELPQQAQGVAVSSEDAESNSSQLQMNRY